MGIFSKKPRELPLGAVQSGRGQGHPFSVLDYCTPAAGQERRLFDALREAIPLVDAAIFRIIRLVGSFAVSCGDRTLDSELEYFLQNVRVGSAASGINAFTGQYLEQLLMYGTAVGEIIPSADGSEIAALYVASLGDIELKRGENPLDVTVCKRDGINSIPLPFQDLLLVGALNPTPERPYGISLLHGLPFVSGILLKIFQSVGQNFERIGNVRFAVTYKPQEDGLSGAYARERAAQIAREWQSAMNSAGGQVSDFVAVGDVDIKVIGADNHVPDTNVPVRQMLEQIVAKTGLPPFLLGLSWSSTERMASQQSDLLTSELECYRRLIEPQIRRICTFWLRLRGAYENPVIEWEDINLQDEVELARARLMRAQSAQIEKGNVKGNVKGN